MSEWLGMNFYKDEGKKISDAVEYNASDAELKLLIYQIFGWDFNSLSHDEKFEIFAAGRKQQLRKLILGSQANNKKYALVENQRELVQALKNDAEVLYLYAGEFKIPADLNNKTYIGRKKRDYRF